MGATLVVDDPILAPVLSGTNFPTSERWEAELAQQREEIWWSNGLTFTGNWTRVAHMVAPRFIHYDTVERKDLLKFLNMIMN